MMIQTWSRVACLILLTTLLSACAGLTKPAPEQQEVEHFYVIDVDRGIRDDAKAGSPILLLEPVKLTSQFRGKTLLFKLGENEYQPQQGHDFFSTPEEMFTEQLQRWLEKTGIFSQVVTDKSVAADMVLQTAVTALYGDKRDAMTPQSVLEMQFFLLSEPSDAETAQTLFQTGLRIDIDIEETTPPKVVKGWQIGLKRLLVTIEDDLSDYFSE